MAEVEKHITVGMWEVLSRHLGLFLRREGQVVLLIHETARDALLSFEKDGFALLDHSNLAQLCLEYLSLVLPSQSDSMLDTKGGAFLAYAVNYWPEHSLLADKVLQRDLVAEKKTSLDHRIHSFLSSPSLRDKWYQLFRKRAISQPAPTLLEIASELGLTSVVEKILVDKDRLEVQDHELQRSLQLATANGCQNITSLLLCRNAVLSPSLPVASVHNRLMILEQLLHYTSKCKIQPRTEYVTQALQAASRSGSLEALDMLMKYVKMTMPDFDLVSNIPLEEAADRQHAEIMAFLLKELEEIMHLSRDDPRVMSGALEQKARGALHAACKRGDEGLVHRLLHWGIAPTVQGLEIAVESGHPMIVKTFLAELSPRQDDTSWLHNSCALIKAAETGRLDIVELLVAAGSPINLVLGDSETALHKAVRNGHKEIAEYLVMHGAERYLPNNDDLTPAQLATQSGYLLIFKAVQELPQPANFNSYIRLAAENGHILMIRYLLRLDHQPINGSDELLTVALATAASKGYLAVVRELCQAKVDVNCRTGEISALHKAGSQGHHQIVEYLLSQGADANASNQIRQTPLHESVKYPLVVKLLIANGSDVEATDLDDRTPLHLAVIAKGDSSETSGLEESIQLLLDAGADVTITDEGGNTALHLAAKHSFLWAANALLSHQAKLSPNLDGQTALHIAAERGNLSILSLLLEKNASMINTADGQGKIPLLCASESGSMECIKVLAAHGSDIDRQSDSGNTPLNVAAVSGNLEIVRFLLQNNADAEIANKRQETPLISTSWGNHVEVAKALLEHGAKMETVNYTCCSPLNLAAKRSHLTLARLLLDHGADTESIDNYRRTPLYSAVQYGSLAIATVLLDHGANVEAADSSGLTPLTLACHRGILDIVTLLLNHGASIEAADDEGWRPLASAVAPGHYDVVRFLIERGANIEAANSYGWRPLGLAAHHGWSNIVQLLLDRKADPDAANSGTWTALESAADQGHYDVARLLVSRGADIEAPDGRALYNAMFHDHFDVCRYLIEQGTNVNAQTSLGETALHVAVRKEQTDIIRLLIEHGADLSATDEFGFTALHVAIRFCAAESAAILLESTASMTCTDLSGRTPIDWLPMQKADGFFKQIPALKGFQPTSQNDRESKTRESLIGIINELEKPDVDQGDLLYRARYLSSQLGDMSCAIRCFVQTATFNSKEKSFELLGFYCDICENEMKHHGYFCTSCPDIDICDGCMEKHKKEPSLRECIGHDYQEFRVPRPDSDNIPDSQSTLKALVEDMRAKYGKA
jgi:ankyrin repeat protein